MSCLCGSLKGAKLEHPVRNGEVLGGHVSLPERPHSLFPQHRRGGVKDPFELGLCRGLDLCETVWVHLSDFSELSLISRPAAACGS